MADEITWVFRLEGEGGGEAPAAGTPSAEGAPAPVRQNPRTTARENAERAEGGAPEVIRKRQAGRAVDTSGRDAAKQAKRLAEGESAAARQAAIGIANRVGLGGVVSKGFAVAGGAAGGIALGLAGVAAAPLIAAKVKAQVDRTADSLAAFSPELAFARASAEAAEVQRRASSAQRNAPAIAELEKSNAQRNRILADMGDFFSRGASNLEVLLRQVSGYQTLLDWLDANRQGAGGNVLLEFDQKPFLMPDLPDIPGQVFKPAGLVPGADALIVASRGNDPVPFQDFD